MIEIVGIVLEIVHPTLFDKNLVYKIPKTNKFDFQYENKNKNLLLNVQIMLYNHLRVNIVQDNEELDNYVHEYFDLLISYNVN
jgi:hypothetical protein